MTDQHLAPTCPHCGEQDCWRMRGEPLDGICGPESVVERGRGRSCPEGAHASAREDYLTEECARAEERAERMRHRGDVWRRRAERVHANSCEDSGRMVMELNEAHATTEIMRGQVQPLQDAYQAEHVEVLRLRAEIERLIGFNRAMVRLPSWEAK
jgi:hypothetical protein